MAKLTYTPQAPGCEVRLTTSSGPELLVRLSGAEEAKANAEGSRSLADNLALVTLVSEYAANELAYRRLRSPEKRASHRVAADREARDAEAMAEMIPRLGTRTVSGWCSGCFAETRHREVCGHQRPTRKFLCEKCGTPTTQCSAPKCHHLAIVNPRAVHTLRYCAAHRHEIPSFEKLHQRLATLDGAKRWLSFEVRNAKRITKVSGGMIGTAAVVAPMAFLAAPVVGAALGSSALGGSLTGAAATSHGLAILGGGSIASGGLGMAGGTAVVTAAGTALGGALGATTVAAYAGADKSFRIELVRPGSGTPVVFAQGFLTEGQAGWESWRSLIEARFPEGPVYQVHWGAKELEDLGLLVTSRATRAAVRKVLVNRAKKGSKAFGSLPGLGAVFIAGDLAANPWTVAKTRAGMTGAVLADLIARTNEGPFVLLGHSLGARVMVSAAQALGTMPEPRIDSMHLLGAAVGRGGDWRTLDKAVAGGVWNYYSSRDQVLRLLYTLAETGERAVGLAGFETKFRSVKDRDVTRLVGSHSDYIRAVKLQR
jgi:pimeloyl-ACP methyl ester carboxylesterase